MQISRIFLAIISFFFTFQLASGQDIILLHSKAPFALNGSTEDLAFPKAVEKEASLTLEAGNFLLLWDKKKEKLHLVQDAQKEELRKILKNEAFTKSYSLSPREVYFLENFADTAQIREDLEAQCVRCAYKPIPGIEQTPPAGSRVKDGNALLFAWKSFKNTKSYHFTLKDLHGNLLYETKLTGTTLKLDKNKLKKPLEKDKTYLWKVLPDNVYYTNKDALDFRIVVDDAEKANEKPLFSDLKDAVLAQWFRGLQAWEKGFYPEALEAFSEAKQAESAFFVLSYAFFRAETKASSPRIYRETLKDMP